MSRHQDSQAGFARVAIAGIQAADAQAVFGQPLTIPANPYLTDGQKLAELTGILGGGPRPAPTAAGAGGAGLRDSRLARTARAVEEAAPTSASGSLRSPPPRDRSR